MRLHGVPAVPGGRPVTADHSQFRLILAAYGAGAAAAFIGALVFGAWIFHLTALQQFIGPITMKTNAALSLLLCGVGLILLAPSNLRSGRLWAGRACAAIVLLVGILTLSEHLIGWDLGIDQLLAVERPGAPATTSPNRMGLPGSTSFSLLGAALLALSWHRRSLHQYFALPVLLIAVLPTVGYLYDAEQFYSVARYTAIAWPTALALMALALGVLCARPGSGIMALLTAHDPGGTLVRRLLLPSLGLPLFLGWLRLIGERRGLYDTAMATALLVLVLIVVLSALVYLAGLRVSRATAVTEQQKQLLAVTLASIGDAVIVTDPQGRITFLNREAERLTGWPAREAEGQTLVSVFRIINEQTRQPVESPVEKVLRLGTVVGLANHTILVAKDGREIAIDDSGAPIRQADGSVHGVVLVFRDFSEKKAAEKALQRNEAQLRTIVENLTEGLVVSTLAGDLIHWNRAALDMHGFASLEECQRRLPEFDQIFELSDTDGAPLPIEQWPLARILRGESLHDVEVRIRRRQGDWQRTFNYGGTLVRDATGEPLLAVVTLSDITQRKRREQDLRRLNRTLRALSDSNRAMVRATDEAAYLDEACRIVVEDCGHALAWVGYALKDQDKTVQPVAQAGFEEGYLRTIQVTWSDAERGRGPTGTAIRTGQVSICNNMLTDPRFGPWRQEASRRGYAASIALPLLADGKAFGSLTIYSRDSSPFSDDEVRLLSELASDLAYGITALRLREAHAISEEQAHRMADMLEAIGRSTPDVIVVKDRDSRMLFANASALSVMGKSAAQVLGRDDLAWHDDPEQAASNIAHDRKVMETNQTVMVEEPFSGRDGPRIYLTTKSALRNADGEVVGIVALARDISERKRMEEELKAAKISAEQAKAAAELSAERAEQASKAKDHFLAVLSHELRTPLTPVLATVSMLQGHGVLDAETRESLEVVRRNVELEARLIDDLLDITRIERGKVELDKSVIDLGTVLRRATEVCMSDIQARKLEFGIDAPDGPLLVEADAARLQQVFWNLIKNAVKFTPHGGCVGIRVRTEDRGLRTESAFSTRSSALSTQSFVIVEINDSGEGIDADVLPRLFTAFEQGERRMTRQFGGLGLGLAISKALVEMHGGTLSAASDGRGKGATFSVRLPLADGQSPRDNSPEPASDGRSKIDNRRLKILLVEDHGDTARIMQKLLAARGHEVQAAADVATALRLFGQRGEREFDLLVSDLGLPDGSGLDLVRQLRASGSNLPAIALSGYGQEQDVMQSRQVGFAAHLIKPVNIEQLQAAIAAVTSQAG